MNIETKVNSYCDNNNNNDKDILIDEQTKQASKYYKATKMSSLACTKPQHAHQTQNRIGAHYCLQKKNWV